MSLSGFVSSHPVLLSQPNAPCPMLDSTASLNMPFTFLPPRLCTRCSLFLHVLPYLLQMANSRSLPNGSRRGVSSVKLLRAPQLGTAASSSFCSVPHGPRGQSPDVNSLALDSLGLLRTYLLKQLRINQELWNQTHLSSNPASVIS